MIILVMGLPGSGKTTLAIQLAKELKGAHINADKVRTEFQDWDFSIEGRIRQMVRLKNIAAASSSEFIIVDFICPTKKLRGEFEADFTIWMNTINFGRFEDTNELFEPAVSPQKIITEFNYSIKQITKEVLKYGGSE
jgi:adenylylsulfate kinase